VARREFRLPDLGEGLTEAEIVRWLVAAGDVVRVNQPLAEVETAKALVELPSPFAGRLVATHGAEGDTIAVGTVLVTIEDEDDEPAGADGGTPAPSRTGEAGGPGSHLPDLSAHRDRDSSLVREAGGRGGPGGPDREPVLVGYGPRASAAGADIGRTRRRRRQPPGAPPAPVSRTGAPSAPMNAFAASAANAANATNAPMGRRPSGDPTGQADWADIPPATREAAPARGTRALAKPPVRKLARDLGVDLGRLSGTGPAGTISRADVESAAGVLAAGPPSGAFRPSLPSRPAEPESWASESRSPQTWAPPAGALAPPGPAAPAASPGGWAAGEAMTPAERPVLAGPAARVGQIPAEAAFETASRTWRVPVAGVRRATARAMVSSAFTAPHVTEFVAADLTETMAARDRLAALPEFAGVKVTPLLFAARAFLIAVRRHPMINSSWVERDQGEAEIVVSEAVNLGIAVASPRGLLVPNIPSADRLDMAGLARGLADLTARTRAGQARPADLAGGTITITNIGVFGVDTGTPVLNPGEAAILALGAVRPAPWVHEGQLAVRTVAQLALSFDHRLVDGELGSAVLADVAAMLTDPTLLFAWS